MAKLAGEFPVGGRRKIRAPHNVDHADEQVSQSSVVRAMARRGLLQPVGYQRERSGLAAAPGVRVRRSTDAPHKVWQLDLTKFETRRDGKWRIAGCTHFFAKVDFPPDRSVEPAKVVLDTPWRPERSLAFEFGQRLISSGRQAST